MAASSILVSLVSLQTHQRRTFLSKVGKMSQASTVMPIVGPHTAAEMFGFVNGAFAAVMSQNAGNSAPVNGAGDAVVTYEVWFDTTTNPVVAKHWDGTSWVVFGKLDTSAHTWTPSYHGTDLGTASTATTGTSGHVLGFLDGANTISALWSFNSGDLALKGASSGSTVLNASATASGTLTLPAATDTLVGKATTDTLTNKTFDTAGTGNSLRINGNPVGANTGTGSTVVLQTSPTLITPTLGFASATTINGITITPNTGTLTLNTNTLGVAGSGVALTIGGPTGTMTFQGTDTYVGRATTDTLTNKTISGPNLINPAVTGVAAFVGSSSGTTSVQASAVAGTTTLTLPAATDTLVGKATTDTLTNKTLTSPVISTITNSGTLTLPTSTDTLVGRATTDTLTNKTLTSPVISTISNTGTVTLPTATTTLVGRDTTDTLTNKSLTAPVVTGTADVQQALTFSGDITPSQITADQNDYAPTGFSTATVVRISTDASRNITGLAGGSDGRAIFVINVGSFAAVLKDEGAGSTAANRFGFGADLTLSSKQGCALLYDSTASRWRQVGGPSASGGGLGTVTSVATDETLTGGPITTSGTIGVSDTYRRNLLLSDIYLAKALAGYRRSINRFTDGFKSATDDGIASGSSSNYGTSSGSGAVTNTTTLTRVSGGTPTTPLGGTAANINDNNTGTSITVTPGNLSGTAAATSRALAYIDYGSNKTITKIEAVGLSISFGPSSSAGGFFYSTDGTNWTQLGSNPTVTTSAATYSATGSVTARYVAWIVPQNNFGAATYTLQDLNGYINLPNNMTVVGTAQTADSSVNKARALIEFDNSSSPTVGTDLTLEVTCDGGTHWTAAGSYTAVSSNSQGGRKVVETDDVSCTSGTSFSYRLKTLNNVLVPVYGVSVTVH
jgi:hypothetical protein